MRLDGVKRGKRTNGTVRYCEDCSCCLKKEGHIHFVPQHLLTEDNSCSGPSVSLNKKGRWAIMKYRPKEAPKHHVPQYYYQDPTKGSNVCSGSPEPWKRPDNRPDFLFNPKPNMVILSKEELMEVLPDADLSLMADAKGRIADEWLCFFVTDGHFHGDTSRDACVDYVNKMGREVENYGTLIVDMSNDELKGRAWECPDRVVGSERHLIGKEKSRCKAKGTNKSNRKRMVAASDTC